MDKNKENKGMQEFDLAWEEYFKDKPKPKSDKEEKVQMEEFVEWYNNVRKQSDTGKTPAEMYKDIYGKDPSQKTNLSKPSRMQNFEWDENYNEEELINEQTIEGADRIFDNKIWSEVKNNIKNLSKKDACKEMFSLGFFTYSKCMDEISEELKKNSKDNPKEFEKAIKKTLKKFDIV